MKNLMKVCFVCFSFLALSVAFTSCGGDTCYNCTGFDDGTTSLEDLGEVCEGDDDGSGGTVTGEQLEEAVAAYELFGGTCVEM